MKQGMPLVVYPVKDLARAKALFREALGVDRFARGEEVEFRDPLLCVGGGDRRDDDHPRCTRVGRCGQPAQQCSSAGGYVVRGPFAHSPSIASEAPRHDCHPSVRGGGRTITLITRRVMRQDSTRS